MDNTQKKLDDIVRKRGNLFCNIVEQNFMTSMMISETKAQYIEAVISGNKVMVILLREQFSSYAQSIAKNVVELQYLMEELGLNEVDFKLN